VPAELIGRRSPVSVITGAVVIPDAGFRGRCMQRMLPSTGLDDSGDLLLVPVFEGSQQLGVLLHRFRLWPAGLRPAGERPPQQPHEQAPGCTSVTTRPSDSRRRSASRTGV
jgi:hypothetical protein